MSRPLPRKLICVLVPSAAATSRLLLPVSRNTPALAGSTADVMSRLPPLATVTDPLSSRFATESLPVSVQAAPVSTAIVLKEENAELCPFSVMLPAPPERPLSVPVPPASSNVLLLPAALLPTTSPMSTPVAPTTRRLAPLPANLTAWLVPEMVPLLVMVAAALYTATPSGPEIDPLVALVTCPPADSRTPNDVVPPMLPLLLTVPMPPWMFTPRWLVMLAPASLLTLPPWARSTA